MHTKNNKLKTGSILPLLPPTLSFIAVDINAGVLILDKEYYTLFAKIAVNLRVLWLQGQNMTIDRRIGRYYLCHECIMNKLTHK